VKLGGNLVFPRGETRLTGPGLIGAMPYRNTKAEDWVDERPRTPKWTKSKRLIEEGIPKRKIRGTAGGVFAGLSEDQERRVPGKNTSKQLRAHGKN